MKIVLYAAIAASMAVALTLAGQKAQSSRDRPFWADLKAGPYAVGFRTLYGRNPLGPWTNSSSPTPSSSGRPIRISIWYPASPAEPMRYGDYLEHTGPGDFAEMNAALDRNDRASWLSDLNELAPPGTALLERVLATPVAAYRDAPMIKRRFPLVLYSGGKASRADANVELGEFLASHGYVVATVPQLGLSLEHIELGSSPEDISLHADDFDAALPMLQQLPDVAPGRWAAIGHSAGGEVAVLLALRHPEVSAVVGLDGSYGMRAGAQIFRRLPEYAAGRKVPAALLDLRRATGSQGATLDLAAVDALHWSAVHRVQFPGAYHGDFTEWGMLAYQLAIPMPPTGDSHTRVLGHRVNQQVCADVLRFLDASLKKQPPVRLSTTRRRER